MSSDKRKTEEVPGPSAKRFHSDEERVPDSGVCSESEYDESQMSVSVPIGTEYLTQPKAGVVTRVFLKNFMCHSSLLVNFNHGINFVHGRNGSGKSAILTALIIGLGGKASSTNRASALKEFIKSGTTNASIEVTLNNRGFFAYKKETYGDWITVQRTISVTGASQYKIKSDRGLVVSNKKDELERVIDALNIQVENPISVLTQEAARTFLNTSDPHKKFDFFLSATRLKELYQIIDKSRQNFSEASAILTSRRQALSSAEKEVEELKRKVTMLQSLQDLREKKNSLRKELHWSEVIQGEKSVEAAQKCLDEASAKGTQLQTDIDNDNRQLEDLSEQLRVQEGRLSEIKERLAELSREEAMCKQEATRSHENHLTKKEEYARVYHRLQRFQKNVLDIRQELEKIRPQSLYENQQRREQALEEIRISETRLTEIKETYKTRQVFHHQLSESLSNLRRQRESVKVERNELSKQIDKLESDVTTMRRTSHDTFSVFGAWVPALAEKIDKAYNERKFTKKPLGPVGAFIQLKDASWAPAVEAYLMSLLFCYCVDNWNDKKVLEGLFKELPRNVRRPSIITSRFHEKVHNTDRGRVQSEHYSSMLDMLIISNPVVANCLIDNREIETILLIPNLQEACRIMSNARAVPHNCKRAITKNGDELFPDPRYRTYAGSGSKQARYLQVSLQDAIRSTEEEIKNLKSQKGEVEKQLQTIENELISSNAELENSRKSINELRQEDMEISAKIVKLKEEAEEAQQNSASFLEEELAECEQKILQTQEEESNLKSEAELLKRSSTEAANKVKRVREKITQARDEEQPLLNEKQRLQGLHKEVSLRKQYRVQKLDKFMENTRRIELELKQEIDSKEKALCNALKVCPRIETQRSVMTIRKELEETNRYINTVEETSGSTKDIFSAYIQKTEKLTRILGDIELFETSLSKLENMLKKRDEIAYNLQRLITIRAQNTFAYVLNLRKFQGRMDIKFREKIVDINIRAKLTGVQDTRSLSGGERSYSTVAFLMSLWEAADPPFYFMDEFDVFMDRINRHVAIDLLLTCAKQKPSSQFSFLTPMEISHIKLNPNITVHRLHDPERMGRQEQSTDTD